MNVTVWSTMRVVWVRRAGAAFLCAAALLGAVAASPALAVVYVDGSKPGGDGSSWAQAYSSIETAVNARGQNEEFWVADGTYQPAASLNLKSGTQLYGGFIGTETSLAQRSLGTLPTAYPTVLDGRNVLSHVIVARKLAAGVVIDGFSVTRGRAFGAGESVYGGGIYVYQATATIANCTFTANAANILGGGMFVREGTATVAGCSFSGNTALLQGGGFAAHQSSFTLSASSFSANSAQDAAVNTEGGGVYTNLSSGQVTGCTFTNNFAANGGAVDLNNAGTTTISGSTFTGNSGTNSGGAVAAMSCTVSVSSSTFSSNTSTGGGGGYYSNVAQTTISDCIFWRNQAAHGGGAMLDYQTGTTDLVQRTLFIDNSSSSEGGALHSFARSMTLDSCAFLNNRSYNGGAIRIHAGEPGQPSYNASYAVTLRNCTVSRNTATSGGGGLINSYAPQLTIYNSIFWDNSAPSAPDIHNTGSGSMTTRSCDIQSASLSHFSVAESNTGRFSQNPQFVDPDGADNVYGTLDDDVRLKPASPCLDRGDGANAPALDLLGFPRCDLPEVANTGVGSPNYADIGAYERLVQAATPTILPAGGSFSAAIDVTFSTTTAGATLRYTTDGSTPTASSTAGTGVTLIRAAVVKVRAFKTGMLDSDTASETYTMPDRDGDGLPDWVETGSGVFVSVTDTGTSASQPDTDGDGWNDGIEVARGTDPNDPNSYPHAVNDFDRDGRSDLGCYYPQGGDWFVMPSAAPFWHGIFGVPGSLPITGDFDGDSLIDYGYYIPSSGTWKLKLSSGGERTEYFGYAGTVPLVGDFDGDGITDFGCYDPDGVNSNGVWVAPPGSWYIMQSSKGLRTESFGYAGTVPLVGDFDGDGITDFGCYDPDGVYGNGVWVAPPGSWYIMQSTKGFRTETFGYAGTIPIVGDFDGDGTTDFGCYDPAGLIAGGVQIVPPGSWYIMQSTKGFRRETFGYAGTEPIVGDFDGDGTADFGCYDAVGLNVGGVQVTPPGSWFIMQTKDGFRTATFGFAGTVPLGGVLR